MYVSNIDVSSQLGIRQQKVIKHYVKARYCK